MSRGKKYLDISMIKHKYKRRGRDSNSRSTREPDLKSGAVPLGHLGLERNYLLSLPFALMDGRLFELPVLPVMSPLLLYPAEVRPL